MGYCTASRPYVSLDTHVYILCMDVLEGRNVVTFCLHVCMYAWKDHRDHRGVLQLGDVQP
jgi:hypothetical protein